MSESLSPSNLQKTKQGVDANAASTAIPYVTRFSYASTDMACQFVFCFVAWYLLKFYTDVAGLSAAVAGTILLIARLVDSVDVPIWGILFDKTHSRWGKSRPWFLWLCVPFATFGVLTFLTPNSGPTIKIIYAAASYMIFNILFTGINVPITSILSALTPDPNKRVMLTCYRMFGSKAGVLLVNATAWPMVAWLGAGNERKGFMLTLAIFAVASILLFLFAFLNLKETIKEERNRVPIRTLLGAINGNWPWLIIFSSSFMFWTAFFSRISMVPYFFEYVWHQKQLVPLVNGLDFVSLGSIFMLPWLCQWTRKRTVWAWGLIGSVAAQFLIYAGCQMHSLPIVLFAWVVGILTSGVAMALPFSVLSDSVDYGEWKSGIRAAGLLTAIGAAFCAKAGSGLGGALPGWVLGAYGYLPNVEQSPASLKGIAIGFIWLPAIFYAIALVPVLFYGKYEALEPQIQQELKQRRAASRSGIAVA